MQRLTDAQKSSQGAAAYSRFINRPLGRRFAAIAYLLGLTPNTVTAISALFTFAGIALVAIAPPTWLVGVVAAAALVTGYALDSADGQLARLRNTGSLAGEWLDHMIDSVKLATVHLAVLLSIHRYFDLDPAWSLLPLAFAVVANVTFFGKILNDQIRRNVQLRTGRTYPGRGTSLLSSLLVAPTDYGFLALSFLLLGAHAAFLALYACMFAASLGFLALAVVIWFREMRRTDPAGA